MLKEYTDLFRRFMMFVDALFAVCAFFLAYALRNGMDDLYPVNQYILYLPVLIIAWVACLYFFGMYQSFRTRSVFTLQYIIFKAGIISFLIFSSFVYMTKSSFVSRGFLLLVFVFTVLLTASGRSVLKLLFSFIRMRGRNYKRILIIGTGKRAQHFIDLIHSHSNWGYKIVGLVDEEEQKKGEMVKGYPVIGVFGDIAEVVRNNVIDEAVFIVPRSWLHRIEDLFYLFEIQGIKIHIAADYFVGKFSRMKLSEISEMPFLSFETTSDRLSHLFAKRVFDILFSALSLVFLSPIFLVLAILIRLNSKGGALFRQERVGLNGRIFTLYKFRTMVEGADEKLNEIAFRNEMDGPVFKMANDPRLTRLGRFLRKFSLDELPQFWNVLKGDMSLVGPRPPIPSEVNKYDTWQRRRLSMRPGLTCLWQVLGRNKIKDFNRWVKLDLEYIDKWSLWLDFKIILNTIPVMLFGIGAK